MLFQASVVVGPVEEHQEDARDGEQDEQEEAEPAEAQRVADLDRVPLHLHRVEVVQHAVHDHVRAVARGCPGSPCLKIEPGRKIEFHAWEPRTFSSSSANFSLAGLGLSMVLATSSSCS